MKVKVEFTCNAGHTNEVIVLDIISVDTMDKEIQEEFLKWLDNNEDCGWEIKEIIPTIIKRNSMNNCYKCDGKGCYKCK
jgi:hypothetical protein